MEAPQPQILAPPPDIILNAPQADPPGSPVQQPQHAAWRAEPPQGPARAIEYTLILPPNDRLERVRLPAGATARDAILAGHQFAPEVNLIDWCIALDADDEPSQLDDPLEDIEEPRYLWLVRRQDIGPPPDQAAAPPVSPTGFVQMPVPVFAATPGAGTGPIPLAQAAINPPAPVALQIQPPVVPPVQVPVAHPPPAADPKDPWNLGPRAPYAGQAPDPPTGKPVDASGFDPVPPKTDWPRHGTQKPSNYGRLVRRLELLSSKLPEECRRCFCFFDYKFDTALAALNAS
jgi:hypothetical protein